MQELIGRITFEADPAADEGGFREMTSLIDVELVDGRTLRTTAEFAKGSPSNPMRDEELIDKFLGCLDWAGIDEATGRAVADRVMGLEHERSLTEVIRSLRQPARVEARAR